MVEPEIENRVGFWPRLGAYMLDMAALWTIAMVLQGPLAKLFPGLVSTVLADAKAHPETAMEMRPFVEWAARLGVASGLLAPLYALFEALRGWSPGKLVLGLRIVSETGERAPLPSLLIRFGIKSSATLVGLAGLFLASKGLSVLAQAMGWATSVGCLLVLSKARTALHDRIAGTAVLRKSDVVVRPPLGAGGMAS